MGCKKENKSDLDKLVEKDEPSEKEFNEFLKKED